MRGASLTGGAHPSEVLYAGVYEGDEQTPSWPRNRKLPGCSDSRLHPQRRTLDLHTGVLREQVRHVAPVLLTRTTREPWRCERR